MPKYEYLKGALFPTELVTDAVLENFWTGKYSGIVEKTQIYHVHDINIPE